MSSTFVAAETSVVSTVATEPSIVSMLLTVIKDTYVEACIVAIAMVFYMRLARLCEPYFWRTLGYKDVHVDAPIKFPSRKHQESRAAAGRVEPAARSAAAGAAPSCELLGFFASLAKGGSGMDSREIVERYEQLVRSQRADLTEQLKDRVLATAAFAAIAEATIQAADVGAKAQITKLLGDMRTFGFPRGRDFYASIARALIGKQFAQDVLWLYDIMVADGAAPDRTMYVCLLNAAVVCNQDQKAVKFFKELCKAGIPSMRTYMTVMRIFTKNQDWRGAVDALENLGRAGGEPDTLALNTVLGICISGGRVDAAERLVETWPAQVDTISCNILLKGYTKEVCMDKAEALLQRMLASGPRPNIISINTSMDCSVRALQEVTTSAKKWSSDSAAHPQSSKAMRAWALLDQLDVLGLEPDRYTCSTLVKGMHLAGCTCKDIDRALVLIKRLDLTAPDPRGDTNARLMEVLFNSLLDACVNIRDLDRMADIFKVMERCKVEVSSVTFGTLMKAFGHAGQLAECHEVWQNMRRARVRPTIVTYGCYIDACIRNNDLPKATEVFASMAADRVMPNAVVYTTMIRGCAQARQPLKALELYHEMRRAGVEPTAVTYNSVLDVVARQLAECDSDSGKLQAVIEDMRKADVAPDAVTYSILMKATCNTGNVDNALALFRELRKHGVVFDEVAFNTLLMACAKADNVKAADSMFEEMLAEGTTPTLITICLLVKMYGKARMLDKAISLSRMMESKFGIQPNLYLFTCLIQACVRNRQFRKSWQVFGQMIVSGAKPDAIAYGTVINGCIYHSKFEEAMAFVRHAYGAPSPSGCQTKSLAALLEMPNAALLQRATPLPLQVEVLSALGKALRRKGQTALVSELEMLTAGGSRSAPSRGRCGDEELDRD